MESFLDDVSVFGAVANMMNGCISHIYSIYFLEMRFHTQMAPRNRPAAKSRGQSNVNVFLRKPMPLIQNGIVKKSTMCLILCNVHVRLAIRENPDQIVKGKGHWPISYNKRYLYVLVVSRTNHREREIYLAIP